MNSLFPSDKIIFNLQDADLEYYPNFFDINKSASCKSNIILSDGKSEFIFI